MAYVVLTSLTGLPVLVTNMELSLECQELQWLLSREDLGPPRVQPAFCLYLSTTLPIHALEQGETRLQVTRIALLDILGSQNHPSGR